MWRKWQPTPVSLPGESQGWGSLVGCCLWGGTESDTTEATKSERAALRTQGLGSSSARRGSSWVTKVPRALCSFRVFQPQIINRVLLCGKQNSGRQESPPQLQDRPTLLRPVPSVVKAMVFPVVVYGCESWTVKKAETFSG